MDRVTHIKAEGWESKQFNRDKSRIIRDIIQVHKKEEEIKHDSFLIPSIAAYHINTHIKMESHLQTIRITEAFFLTHFISLWY